MKTLEERFWEKVERSSDGCWLWTGHRTAGGYGTFWVGGSKRHAYAHRVSIALNSGESIEACLSRNDQHDHLCRVRHCVNPEHIQPHVTARENILAGDSPAARNFRKTHCVRGHEFTPENTGTQKARGVVRGRFCRECERLRRVSV